MKVDKKGLVVWFTGLPGAGKSTLAEALLPILVFNGMGVKILDGDEVRKYLTVDLGFSKEDRSENIRRISFVAKSIADIGGVAICAVISPYEEDRKKAKEFIGTHRFFEVFVDCNIDILKERDTKGLYKKAINGEILNFTGISDPYEIPENFHCKIDSGDMSIQESVDVILTKLKQFLNPLKQEIMFYI